MSFVLMILAFVVSGQATSQISKGYLVKIQFKFQTEKKTVASSGELIFAKNNKSWVTLVNSKQGITVLGRVVESKSESLHMEYIVVDSSQSPNGVISTPQIVSRLGEDALIEIGRDDERISLKMNATETESSD